MTKYTTDDIIIKPYSAEDFENYFRLQLEDKLLAGMDETVLRKHCEEGWKNFLNGKGKVEYFSVFFKRDMTYCGSIELQRYEAEYSLGINVLEKYQHMGVGTSAVRLFCGYCFNEREIKRLMIKINSSNKNSVKLFEKVGARYVNFFDLKKLIEESGITISEETADRLIILSGIYTYELILPLSE